MIFTSTKRSYGQTYMMYMTIEQNLRQHGTSAVLGMKDTKGIMAYLDEVGLAVVAQPVYMYDVFGEILETPKLIGYKFKRFPFKAERLKVEVPYKGETYILYKEDWDKLNKWQPQYRSEFTSQPNDYIGLQVENPNARIADSRLIFRP